MEYEIRSLRPGEAAKLKSLACPNFSVVEQMLMTKPKLGVVAQTSDGRIAGGSFLVITDAGGNKVGCVDIIFVLPQFRGTGVAGLLYNAAVKMLRENGCGTIMALVRGDNSQSLCRFEAEGLHPISLTRLKRRIGARALAVLFVKTASLACATGCWVLCEGAAPEDIGTSKRNILRTVTLNGLPLLLGALVGAVLCPSEQTWWNIPAALLLLSLIIMGETIGKHKAGGDWRFVLPEGGLLPTTVIALLGGFYPIPGHWYLTRRNNSQDYRRLMAKPAVGAWLTLLAVTPICEALYTLHPLFSSIADLGVMLLLFYALPFYPFDTFGGRRVREYSKGVYAVLAALSAAVFALMEFGV